MKSCALFLLGCVLSLCAAAQSIENIRYAQQGTRLIVTYDLMGPTADASYTISLFASHNNFTTAASNVTGAVGKGQKPGPNKRIEWDMGAELKAFSGQIVVELLGVPEVSKLAFKEVFISPKAKVGKKVNIGWTGGSSGDVKIDVYREGRLVTSLGERKNNGSYDWQIPPDMEKGDGFTLRLVSGSEIIESAPFAIKGKPPMLIIAGSGAAVVITGVIVWIIMRPVAEAPDP